MYTRLQHTDFYGPVSFLFFSIGRLLDITYLAITYPRLLRTSPRVRRPANALHTADSRMDHPAGTAWSLGEHAHNHRHWVTRLDAQSPSALAFQGCSDWVAEWGKDGQAFGRACMCNLIRLWRGWPAVISPAASRHHVWWVRRCRWDRGDVWQPTDDDIIVAVTAPAEPGSATPSDEEKEERGDCTSLDLPGRLQNMEALDTLQRYLLGVSNSENAKTSLLSHCTTQMTLDNF